MLVILVVERQRRVRGWRCLVSKTSLVYTANFKPAKKGVRIPEWPEHTPKEATHVN